MVRVMLCKRVRTRLKELGKITLSMRRSLRHFRSWLLPKNTGRDLNRLIWRYWRITAFVKAQLYNNNNNTDVFGLSNKGFETCWIWVAFHLRSSTSIPWQQYYEHYQDWSTLPDRGIHNLHHEPDLAVNWSRLTIWYTIRTSTESSKPQNHVCKTHIHTTDCC
jgi:hypothetical protein